MTTETMCPLWELQKRIFALLAQDAMVKEKSQGVFSHVPANTPFPYITLGEMEQREEQHMVSVRSHITFPVTVFYRGKSIKVPYALVTRIRKVLQGVTLYMATCTITLSTNHQFLRRLRDGKSWQGEVRVEGWMVEG